MLKVLRTIARVAVIIDRKIQKLPSFLKVLLVLSTLMLIAGVLWFVSTGNTVSVLNTKGIIADKQRHLIYFTVLLSLIVVIPVYVMLYFFAFRYRKTSKADYKPNWASNKIIETIWWGIPIIIISILSVVTWNATHDLDPFKKINSPLKPLKVQVVALDWKWLFIYPEQKIATINNLTIPENTPIDFQITSDAAMNSFWIPQLAGQVYAMAGMDTQLHIMANESGLYEGSSSNISGEGFAGMRFKTVVTTASDFESWVRVRQKSSEKLSLNSYVEVAKPSKNNMAQYFVLEDASLYNFIKAKYMNHSMGNSPTGAMQMEGN